MSSAPLTVLEGAKAAAEPARRARATSFILDLLDVDKLGKLGSSWVEHGFRLGPVGDAAITFPSQYIERNSGTR